MRLAKTNVRSLGSHWKSVQAIDLLGRLAMGIGLVRAKIVSKSGRGRNQTIDEVWNPDEQLIAEWNCLTPSQQWLRLLAEWCRPQGDFSGHRSSIDTWCCGSWRSGAGSRLDQPRSVRRVGRPSLRTRGRQGRSAGGGRRSASPRVIASSGPAGLTELGAAALRDPVAAADIEVGGSTQAIVQADHTVIAPPDLRADVAAWLASIAVLESDAGAFIYRLDPHLLTVAVQAGKTPESILGSSPSSHRFRWPRTSSGWCGTLPGGQEGSG